MNYLPICFARGWTKEKYYGWSVLHDEPGFKVTARKYGLARRVLVMAVGKTNDEISEKINNLGLASALSIVVVHDFSAQEERESIAIANKNFRLLSGDRRLMNTNTFCVDLSESVEALWEKMLPNAKGVMTKAEKIGATVEFLRRPGEVLDTFYSWYTKMALERKLDVPSRQVIEKMFASGDLLAAACRSRDGALLAINLIYTVSEYAYYLYGVNGPDKTKSVGQFVQWETMKYLKGQGARWYDLGGVPSADPSNGIFQFKKSIGGTFVALGHEYEHMPLTLKIPFSLYRRFRGGAKH